MAYFKLAAPTRITKYPFDYHSHFTGILPVQRADDKDPRPSLAALLADTFFKDDPFKAAKGELKLFDFALEFMMDPATNPFARLLKSDNRAQYERAECAAENIYVASVLLGRVFAYLPIEAVAQSAVAPYLYGAVRKQVVEAALGSTMEPDKSLMKIVEYFNSKVYSANKYTPFDDCYKMRGTYVKLLCGGDPANRRNWDNAQKKRYIAWIVATFAYLQQEGITHTQTAATEDEMGELAAQAAAYNNRNGTSYKLLAHTPHQYLPDKALGRYLDSKILPLLVSQGQGDIVGLDLLGAENKVGNYKELFEFLLAKGYALQANFGPGKPRSLKLITHIHCGEGSGFGTDNRSMIGYYMYEVGDPDAQFYADFAGYILSCYRAAEARLRDTPRGTAGTAVPFGLFDELFHNNSLTYRGRVLRRFDISSEKSRELSAYNAKRNVMALSETLDSKPEGQDCTWYQLLMEKSTLFAIRLGHDYYYRNYMAAKYPQIAFDTNLGSNAITGASGLFNSIEGYRINRGFRHLDGYIDTNVLQATSDAVAYMASEALTQEQITWFTQKSAEPGSVEAVFEVGGNKSWIELQLKDALGPLYDEITKDFFYGKYVGLTVKTAGDVEAGAYKYQAMTRVLTLFQNWRSYLLGADGQGAEHTNIQNEFLRMIILLAYSLLPTGQTRIDANLMLDVEYLLREIARVHWRNTIGATDLKASYDTFSLESLEGFKSPDSVVTLRRKIVQQ